MIENKVYIYALIDPDTNNIRYIGKTIYPQLRYSEHLNKKCSNKHKDNWIALLKKNNKVPIFKIMEVINSDDWKEREKYYIKLYKNTLVNLSEGGNGGFHSDDANKKRSLKLKGKPTNRLTKGFTGGKHTKKIKTQNIQCIARSSSMEQRHKMEINY